MPFSGVEPTYLLFTKTSVEVGYGYKRAAIDQTDREGLLPPYLFHKISISEKAKQHSNCLSAYPIRIN